MPRRSQHADPRSKGFPCRLGDSVVTWSDGRNAGMQGVDGGNLFGDPFSKGSFKRVIGVEGFRVRMMTLH